MFSGPMLYPNLDAASLRRPSSERVGGGGAATMPELDDAVRELAQVSAARPLMIEAEGSPLEQRQAQRYALEARLQAARAETDEDSATEDSREGTEPGSLEGRIRAMVGDTGTPARSRLDLLS